MEHYTLEYLQSLPTLCVSQADDLKIEKPNLRVWLSRCGVDDGEEFENTVTYEEFDGKQWYESLICGFEG